MKHILTNNAANGSFAKSLLAFRPLAGLTRGDVPEIVVYGACAKKTYGKKVQGDDFELITRSLLSPWQFLACGQEFIEDFFAIGLSLHSGTDEHMAALIQLSRLIPNPEDLLICPREYPIDPQVMLHLKRQGQTPSRLHHPNSGRHLLLLYACMKEKWTLSNYWDSSHPLQKKIFTLVGREACEEIRWIYDGCGLPTSIMNASTHLNMWEKFILDDSYRVKQLKQLWLKNLLLVGGEGRLETELILATEGRVLAKEGSDGLMLIQSMPYRGQKEDAASLIVKLAGGYHTTRMTMALLSALSSFGDWPDIFSVVRDYLKAKLERSMKPGLKFVEFDKGLN